MTESSPPDLQTLVAEFERQQSHAPVTVVARNGEVLAKPERLTFQPPPPPPMPDQEIPFMERLSVLDHLVKPLRERVEESERRVGEIEQEYDQRGATLEQQWQAKMAEAEEALRHRNSVEAAMASIRNVSTGPVKPPTYDPVTLFKMSEREWEDYKKQQYAARQ